MRASCSTVGLVLVVSLPLSGGRSPTVGGPEQAGGDPASGLYRAAFDKGLTALKAGHNEEAADRFRAAGEFAPDAPVWKAYLAHAEGREEPLDLDLTPDERGPWTLARAAWEELGFDPTGERLVSGNNPATLWDARSGERIAVLIHRSSVGAWLWRFDDTGRLIVGVGRSGGDHRVSAGIDVRSARTGEPIGSVVAVDLEDRWNMRFEWAPKGSRVADAESRHTFQLPLPGGVLRCITHSTGNYDDYEVGPDGRRGAYLDRTVPTTLRLVDLGSDSTIALVRPAGYKILFSGSGRFVATPSSEGIILLEAESGKRLANAPARRCIFDGDLLVFIDPTGAVVHWDPEEGQEVSRLQLDPVPGRAGLIAFAAGGDRLIFGNSSTMLGYDTASGRQVWKDQGGRYRFVAALSADRLRLVSGSYQGRARILDVRTGATLSTLVSEPLGVMWVEALEGADACVVCASDGTLRHVDLGTGVTMGVAAEHRHAREISVRTLGPEALLTWADGRELCLRDPATLIARQTIELEPGIEVLAVALDASRFATRSSRGMVRVWSLTPEHESIEIEGVGKSPYHAAFSPDGTQLALIYDDRVGVFDSVSGARVAGFPTNFFRQEAHVPGPIAFYGEDRLAASWGGNEKVGVDILGLPGGERVARLNAPMCWVGGAVADLRCDPDVARLVFSVSSCGVVYAFREEDWKECWRVDYGGGNAAPLELHRAAPSTRLFISGMGVDFARVVDLVTGEVLAKEPVEGCYDLAGTSSERFVIGSDGGLAVHSGESFERLYVRTEGPEGSAWILRAGETLEVVGARGWVTDLRHLERGGTSRPADCWDAWLLDPLALCPVSLDILPEPPHIVSGPARVVIADSATVEIEVEAAGEEVLIGLQVEVAGRTTEFEPVADEPGESSQKTTLAIDGPWPAEVRLRAIDRAGVLSAPWRVAIEAGR